MAKVSVLLLCGAFGGGCAAPRGGEVNAGPLFRSTPDFSGNAGFQAAGPFVEHRRSPDGKAFTAVRPFWGRVQDPELERSVTDILWPLGMFRTRGNDLYWWFLPAYGHDFDTETSASRHRWTVFPVLFGGRSASDIPYFAVFPVGGVIHEILGRDRVSFVLFPLYMHSQLGENRTTSVLWPIYSRTTGGQISRLRVWPLYGYSHNPERWNKQFVLWPLWTSVEYLYPNMKGDGFVLFPLYGQVRLPDRQSRMFLPPFFKVEWGAGDHFALNAPWPFLQYAHTPDYEKYYLFPLAGRRRIGHDHSWFALWPVMGGRRTERPREVLTRFRIVPIWYYENLQAVRPVSRDTLPEDEKGEQVSCSVARYMRLWPLGVYRREGDVSLTRIPDLWPLKNTPAIERNWAPLWTLYRREKAEGRSSTELLWGMVRVAREEERLDWSVFPLVSSARKAEGRSWRLLYGLAGYEREGLQKSYQLLYFVRIRRGGTAAAVRDQEEWESP
jgi:hypothetical protein